MNTFLANALCLPAADVEALIQGRTIVAITHSFVNPNQTFALYADNVLLEDLPIEDCYRSSFLPIAKSIYSHWNPSSGLVSFWARCELCQIIESSEQLKQLSRLTIWTEELLLERLKQRQYVFLTYLRVFKTNQTIEVIKNSKGKFLSLQQPVMISEPSPILSEGAFSKLRRQLEQLKPPSYPELEELHSAIAQLAEFEPLANSFNHQLEVFLGWGNGEFSKQQNSELEWIETVAATGNSSDGHEFEKLVRRGLLKLGFTGSGLNPNATGGSGGMDFYCEKPYPMVGECKATKTETVSDGTPAQLLKIGMNHLGKDQYDRSIKLIVAAGDLNFFALRTATENEMNVIRPETLQSLIEMQAKYQGSVNLIELKKCLQQDPFGIADDKINTYLDKVRQNLKVRSHIIDSIKQLAELEPNRTQFEVIEIRTQYNAAFAKSDGSILDNPTVHELLIELSSPLAGYLGRVQGGTGLQSDRFYWLRDLPIDEI